MKLLLLLFSSIALSSPGILVIDIGMKHEIKATEDFTIEDYFKKSFPVYADDITAVINATEKIARSIDRNTACVDTVYANRTMVYMKKNCDGDQSISVRFVTKMEDKNMYFDFELVRKETDRRLAQQRLLDFAAYLSK